MGRVVIDIVWYSRLGAVIKSFFIVDLQEYLNQEVSQYPKARRIFDNQPGSLTLYNIEIINANVIIFFWQQQGLQKYKFTTRFLIVDQR